MGDTDSTRPGSRWAMALIALLAAGAVTLYAYQSIELAAARSSARYVNTVLNGQQKKLRQLSAKHAALSKSFDKLQAHAVALAQAVDDALANEIKIDLGAAITPGMNYCDWEGRYGSGASQRMIRRLADMGIRKLVFTPTHYQRRANSTEIYADRRHSHSAKTPTHEQLAADIRLAHELGMEVGLKLHIDPEDETPRGEIKLDNDADYAKWFANYRRILLGLVDFAKAERVEHFYVGCELSEVVNPPHTEAWRGLIRDVRQRFLPHRPKLTYASQHTNTYNVQFWRDLDYIGMNTWPYFRPSSYLSIRTMKSKWKSVIYMIDDRTVDFFDYVHFVADTFGKPVVLTELGCQSKAGAAYRPVIWNDQGKPAPLVQAYFYFAFFAVLREDMAQFARTRPGQAHPIVGVDSWNCLVTGGGPDDADYTIVGKPAEMLWRKLFAQRQPQTPTPTPPPASAVPAATAPR